MKTEVRKINKTTAEMMLKKNYSNRKLTKNKKTESEENK